MTRIVYRDVLVSQYGTLTMRLHIARDELNWIVIKKYRYEDSTKNTTLEFFYPSLTALLYGLWKNLLFDMPPIYSLDEGAALEEITETIYKMHREALTAIDTVSRRLGAGPLQLPANWETNPQERPTKREALLQAREKRLREIALGTPGK